MSLLPSEKIRLRVLERKLDNTEKAGGPMRLWRRYIKEIGLLLDKEGVW